MNGFGTLHADTSKQDTDVEDLEEQVIDDQTKQQQQHVEVIKQQVGGGEEGKCNGEHKSGRPICEGAVQWGRKRLRRTNEWEANMSRNGLVGEGRENVTENERVGLRPICQRTVGGGGKGKCNGETNEWEVNMSRNRLVGEGRENVTENKRVGGQYVKEQVDGGGEGKRDGEQKSGTEANMSKNSWWGRGGKVQRRTNEWEAKMTGNRLVGEGRESVTENKRLGGQYVKEQVGGGGEGKRYGEQTSWVPASTNWTINQPINQSVFLTIYVLPVVLRRYNKDRVR